MPAPARAESPNFGAAFGWQGFADTDLAFSSFFGGDHTIAFRFLPQFTMVGEAPIFCDNGQNNFTAGIGGYRAGGGEAVKLELQVGKSMAFYSFGKPAKDGAPIPLEDKWHTAAIVRSGNTFKFFLDGKRIDKDGGGDLVATSADISSVTGNVRLGRRNPDDLPQYYGFVDDVAVFNKAMSQSEIAALFAVSRFSASIDTSSLVEAWTFDKALPDGSPLPPKFAHPVTRVGSADQYGGLSETRDSAKDVRILPLTFQTQVTELPFEPGDQWWVLQGNEGLASHNDYAAFSWDFRRGDPSVDQAQTCGTKVTSIGTGTIVRACDLGDPTDVAHLEGGCSGSAAQFTNDGPLIDGYDFMNIDLDAQMEGQYLHLQKGSMEQAMSSHASDFKHSPVTNPAPLSIPVTMGEWIARAGTRGKNNCHLHQAVGKPVLGGTFPTAFSNYEVLDPSTHTWKFVRRGRPRVNQIIRRPPVIAKGPTPRPSPEAEPGICEDGFKAGPAAHAGTVACEHICRGHEKH